MEVPVAVVQVSVTWDSRRNLAAMTGSIADAEPGEVVVFPEACLSGYDDNLSGLDHLDPDTLASAVTASPSWRAANAFTCSAAH